MPQVSTHEISTGRFLDKYARSVIMSTYVVAFVVSNFDCAANLNHRIFLRPALIANRTADYAIGVSTGILEAIADFVNVPYSLEKMDQIGIPDDYFSVGAMENWGLVIYSEEFLVHVNRLTLATSKQTTITFISHEFGHQWFGNLVSPLWWTYVWLSEGFATYFQYYGASVDGSMDLMDQMVIKCVQKALGEDDTTSTRPMNLEVGSPDDINSLFDHVAYRKSGSVIRMVEGVMTTKAFRIGLNHYLNKMQYGAAEPSDLYSSCQAALDSVNMNPFQENVNMASVMRTWDSNAGFPLVTVTRDYAVGSVHLYQRRFISANQKNDDDSIWYVPISYGTTTNPDPLNRTPKLWLTGRNLTTTIDDLNIDNWLLINIQETGYYRVNYDVENWNRISDYLNTENFNQIHKLNRAQLLEDSFNLAKFGVIGFDIPLSLMRYVQRETEYVPFTTIYNDFKTFISNTLNAAMTAVGCDERENDRHVSILSRSSLLTWTGKFGNEACREVGLQRIREWAQDQGKSISPNLQRALTCTGLRIAEQSDWDFIFDRYVNEPEALKNIDLLLALGCSENIEILDRFLDRILDSNSDLRSEHRIIALSSICYSGKFGRDYLIYNYITNNWTKVTSGSLTTSQIASAMRHIAVRSSTEQQYKDLDAFGQQVGYNFTDALNTIRSNMNWSNQHMPAILNWFNKMYKLQL
ncbi:ERAP1-like C-terminal domain [Popillia japonica]|uniref:ERAP1-like C-terminal domain n=1 Tax=Popillia japonica TaxID=7064 RepID=A0AAW1K2X0_POPJA